MPETDPNPIDAKLDALLSVLITLSDSLERIAIANEKIAAQMPALIAASEKRGGGSWGKKNALGLFKIPPDPSTLKPNDAIQVPTAFYVANEKKIEFFSPFDPNGVLTGTLGVKLIAVTFASKTWQKLFTGWEPMKDSVPGRLFRIATLSVMKDKEKEGRQFYILDKIEKPPEGVLNPDLLKYAALTKEG